MNQVQMISYQIKEVFNPLISDFKKCKKSKTLNYKILTNLQNSNDYYYFKIFIPSLKTPDDFLFNTLFLLK